MRSLIVADLMAEEVLTDEPSPVLKNVSHRSVRRAGARTEVKTGL